MTRTFIIALFLLPYLVCAQATKEDYAIYSKYLKNYNIEKGRKMTFVVRESTDYARKYDTTGIKDIITNLRNYLSGDAAATPDVTFTYRSFADSLKKDTKWLSLVTALDQKMKKKFILKNDFSKSLHTSLLSNSDYAAWFSDHKQLEKAWAKFHDRYSKSAVMIEFSEIALSANNQRGVFYFIKSCGSLCAAGYIVFCYKENNEWKFIYTLPLWQS